MMTAADVHEALLVCVLGDCHEDVVFTLMVHPHFLPWKPIDDASIAELRKFPGATVDYHADGHLSATMLVCFRHAGDAVDIWTRWLNGEFDPAWEGFDGAWATEEDEPELGTNRQAEAALVDGEQGRVEAARAPRPAVTLVGPGALARRSSRKRDRQNRKRGRR